MAKQTLFSVLSRAPWWASLLIAAGLFAAGQVFLPDIVAFSATLPFLIVAAYSAWRHMRVPHGDALEQLLTKLCGLSRERFMTLMTEAFRHDGYRVKQVAHAACDLELQKNDRLTLVSCRRWKVAQTGAEALRELRQAQQARDAHACMYVSTGDFTPQARTFASENHVELISGAALGTLVRRLGRARQREFLT